MTDVYIMDIRSLADDFYGYLKLVPPARQKKVLAFAKRDDQLRSLAAGLLLSRILGKYDTEASSTGKPFISGCIPFNLAHAGNYAVAATGKWDLGVDIESIGRPMEHLARKILTPDELSWACGSLERICRLWARKESIAKADGRGISLKFAEIDALPSNNTCLLNGKQWHVFDRRIDDYWLAVASAENCAPSFHVVVPPHLSSE